ncbi:MAG: hypothetical protein M3R45_05010 [Pseudomonadota bacterium]|nr:hypothetical protein [Pseudomonadota bacterium]
MFDGLFDAAGRWETQPQEWYPDVAEHVAHTQLMRLLQACLTRLPANTSRVFLMREYLGLDTPEICEATAFTPGNVRALLYRARMGLRSCLSLKVSQEENDDE